MAWSAACLLLHQGSEEGTSWRCGLAWGLVPHPGLDRSVLGLKYSPTTGLHRPQRKWADQLGLGRISTARMVHYSAPEFSLECPSCPLKRECPGCLLRGWGSLGFSLTHPQEETGQAQPRHHSLLGLSVGLLVTMFPGLRKQEDPFCSCEDSITCAKTEPSPCVIW